MNDTPNTVTFSLSAGLFHLLMVELEFASAIYGRNDGSGHSPKNCNVLLAELYQQTGVKAWVGDEEVKS